MNNNDIIVIHRELRRVFKYDDKKFKPLNTVFP